MSDKVDPPFCPPDIEWKKMSDPLPEGIILCGEYDQSPAYTGRTYHEGELLVGTVIAGKKCIFSKNGEAHETSDFQVMTVPVGDPLVWESLSPEGEYPEDTIYAGRLKNEDRLRIGRVIQNGNTLIGWIDGNKCLHVAQDGKEATFTEFEVVIHKFLKFLAICPPCPQFRCPRQ